MTLMWWIALTLLAVAGPNGAEALGASAIVGVNQTGDAVAATNFPEVSDQGRFVAFWSEDSSLVPGDTNRGIDVEGQTLRGRDVFVRDRARCTTERVSVTSDGVQALGESFAPSISGDGRLVAFVSDAKNLWPANVTWHPHHVYVHDRWSGVTELVSVNSAGEPGDGDNNAPPGRTSLSRDGRYVAFSSASSNLADNDANGGGPSGIDVFVRDRDAGITILASVDSDGDGQLGASTDPTISGDGRHVVFRSAAPLAPDDRDGGSDLYLRDVAAGTTTRVNVTSTGEVLSTVESARLSDDGCLVGFRGDGGSTWLFDCRTGYASPLPVNSGIPPLLSGDGTVVGFGGAPAGGPTGLFRFDLALSQLSFVSPIIGSPVLSVAMSRGAEVFATDHPVTVYSDGPAVPSLCEDSAACNSEDLPPVDAATCILLRLGDPSCPAVLEFPERTQAAIETAFDGLWSLRLESGDVDSRRGQRDVRRQLRRARTALRRWATPQLSRECRLGLRRQLREAARLLLRRSR
jgi:WD40-like Beta Propeller Repeat